MVKNLVSLGLLRNGKVYANKSLAYQGLQQEATNDGVAKLARYLQEISGETVICTLVGFYANADEMEDAQGGQSHYTILDVDGGTAGDVQEIREEIAAINDIIGDGIDSETLTDAINEINDKLGSGFTSGHTVEDALAELEAALTDALTITLDVASEPTSGFLKTYVLSQGGNEVGKIDIPKDMVVSGGSLVHGTWSGDTFTEDPDGTDTAIKIEFANADVIYINTTDLVDFYTGGDGIDVDNNTNTISLKLDDSGEAFLTVGEDGIKIDGVQTAIDTAIAEAIESSTLEASDGISIAANQIKAVAAKNSAPAVKNPIVVDGDGIKFASILDCGFFDDETTVATNAADIAAIEEPANTDVFINGDDAMSSLTTKKTFKNLEIADVEAAQQVYLSANETISLDNVDVTGDKGSTNGYFLMSAPVIEVSNITVEDGAKPYNVFEDTGNGIDEFNASNVKVDDVSLKHNVFNIYKANNDAVISVSDSKFNLDVNNSNVLRLANYTNATGVTVNFENIEWTYENTPNKEAADWDWAGLIIYQPASTDVALNGDLTAIETWTFNFKNCKYNGAKVTENNFGEHNQAFYLYNVGNDGSVKDPVVEGLNVNFS